MFKLLQILVQLNFCLAGALYNVLEGNIVSMQFSTRCLIESLNAHSQMTCVSHCERRVNCKTAVYTGGLCDLYSESIQADADITSTGLTGLRVRIIAKALAFNDICSFGIKCDARAGLACNGNNCRCGGTHERWSAIEGKCVPQSCRTDWLQIGNNCYYSVGGTWDNVLTSCNTLNATMFNTKTQAEFDAVENACLNQNLCLRGWIGGRMNSSSIYVWLDGTLISLSMPWFWKTTAFECIYAVTCAHGVPGSCTLGWSYDFWHCDHPLGGICQYTIL